MPDISTLAIGGGALALIGTFWTKIRGFFQTIIRLAICTVNIHDDKLAAAIIRYCYTHHRMSFLRARSYTSGHMFVRSDGNWSHVGFERLLSNTPNTFWKKIFPIWVSPPQEEKNSDKEYHHARGSGTLSSSKEPKITISFFRGSLNIDELIGEAIKDINDIDSKCKSNYRVSYIHGTDDSFAMQHSDDGGAAGFDMMFRTHIPMDHEWSDLGPKRRDNPMVRIELSDESKDAMREIDFWHCTQEWYKDRDITWKRGYMLYGSPGCGKTSFVRAVAEKLDLPVFVFDLASLSNMVLAQEWSRAISTHFQRIILIEDIDNVFNKRNNIAKAKDKQGVTFDKLLNLIDGIEEMDGTLIFVTTNDIDKVDDALKRPGRLDRHIEFAPLSCDAKKRLAKNILIESDDIEVDSLVKQSTSDETPAAFRERCVRKSLEKQYETIS